MTIARVLGTVVSTVKHPKYRGLKLFVVQPVNEYLEDSEPSFLAVDTVQAGVGDIVLVNREGNGARQIFRESVLPIRAVIVGVVDHVEVGTSHER